MWEFIQANATWIVLGVFVLLMMRMHGGGRGCGSHAGHGSHGDAQEPAPPAGTTPRTVSDQPRRQREEVGSGSGRPTAGCH